jgi:KUP system potassium uptake protein
VHHEPVPPSMPQHACTLIFRVDIRDVPRVPPESRIEEEALAPGFWGITAYYGFKDHPDVPEVVASLPARGLPVDLSAVSYFLSRSIVAPRAGSAQLFTLSMRDMVLWRKYLFAVMYRNATSAVTYFALPGDAVIELGAQVLI